jgi:cytochrome c-type biogenesis protein CcsB
MSDWENIWFILSLVSIVAALIFSIVAFINSRKTSAVISKSGNKAAQTSLNSGLSLITTILSFVSLLFLSLTIINRAIQTGHGPFTNMYEFALAFAWGIVLAAVIFRWRYKTSSMLNIGLAIAILLLIFASMLLFTGKARISPLVPALQQSTLLSAHVASAVVAYGTLTIGFGAAILFLIQNRRNSIWLPNTEILDMISYRTVVIGFPFLTLLIVLGALWADIAWGRYWSWDPKETASLATWLIYAAYIHTRVLRGWRNTRSAVLLIIGFAAILLTFFGNYIFQGLHAYG